MPAAAVIPAPIAYIKVVAVKKLVVGFLPRTNRSVPLGEYLACLGMLLWRTAYAALDCVVAVPQDVYFEEIRVFQAGHSP